VANIRAGGRLKRAAATRPPDIDFSAAISAKTEWACLLVAATRDRSPVSASDAVAATSRVVYDRSRFPGRFTRAFRIAHRLTFRTARDGMSELTSKLDIARPVERPTGVARNRDDSQRADD
jgi:hypothetical protein